MARSDKLREGRVAAIKSFGAFRDANGKWRLPNPDVLGIHKPRDGESVYDVRKGEIHFTYNEIVQKYPHYFEPHGD